MKDNNDRLMVSRISECWECSAEECPWRIEHGTADYTQNYDFENDICPIPEECPWPKADKTTVVNYEINNT